MLAVFIALFALHFLPQESPPQEGLPQAAPPQEGTTTPDWVSAVEIKRSSEAFEGKGQVSWVRYQARFEGTLHVWALADFDVVLSVENKDGVTLVADDNSGGGTTPYVELAVEQWDLLRIGVIASEPGTTGWVELHVVRAPETWAMVKAAKQSASLLSRAAAFISNEKPSRARKLVAEAFEVHRNEEAQPLNSISAKLMDELISAASSCGAESVVRQAYEYKLAFLEQTRPSAHLETTRARAKLALVRKRDLDYAGARQLERIVLADREGSLPSSHLLVLRARQHLADTLLALGEFDEARQLFDWVLDIRSQSLKPDNPEILMLRGRLAAVMKAQGDVAGASVIEESVLETAQRFLPSDHIELVHARINLANSLIQLGELYRAQKHLELAFAEQQKLLVASDPELLSCMQVLASVLRETGDAERAVSLGRQVWKERMVGLEEAHPERLHAMSELATSLYFARELEESLALRSSVLASYESLHAPYHEVVLRARLEASISMSALGNHVEAYRTQAELLDLYEHTVAVEDSNRLRARHSLALTMGRLGDWSGARAFLLRVLEVRELRLPADNPVLSRTRVDLARASEELGIWSAALELRETVDESNRRHLASDDAEVLLNRQASALDLLRLNRIDDALVMQTSVLDAWSAKGATGAVETGEAREQLAEMFLEVGDFESAKGELELLLKLRRETLGTQHHLTLRTEARLAEILASEGALAEASKSFMKLLELRKRVLPEFHESILRNTVNLVMAESVGKESKELAGNYWRLRKLIDIRTQLALTRSWGEGQATMADDAYAISMADFLHEQLEPANYTKLFESFANRALVRSVPTGLLPNQLPDGELAVLLSTAAELNSKIDAHLNHVDLDGRGLNSTDKALLALSKKSTKAEAEIQKLFAEQGLQPEPVRAWSILKLLGKKNAAVVFYRASKISIDRTAEKLVHEGDHLKAIVLEFGKSVSRVDFGPLSEIEALVEDWRSALGAPFGGSPSEEFGHPNEESASTETTTEERELAAGRALRIHLLSPLLDVLDADIEALYILPDDVIRLVPLDSLPSYGERFGDQLRVQVLPEFRALEEPPVGPVPKPAMLIVGDVDYDGEAVEEEPVHWVAPAAVSSQSVEGGVTKFVTSSETELQSIAAAYQQIFGSAAVILSGDRATKATVMRAAREAEYLHLATQGWFPDRGLVAERGSFAWSSPPFISAPRERASTDFDLRCGLALVGANRGRDSSGRVPGILTVRELSALDLSGCELAVISGYDPELSLRESIHSLELMRSVLQTSGAGSTLISIWEADPSATRELMEFFYEYHWRDGLTKGEALWKAKLALRLSGRPVRDWAGWVLSGTPWR